MFLITFGGSFLTFKILTLTSDKIIIREAGFRDVFAGYQPKYKKGFNMSDKAQADHKASLVNDALYDILPWMLIAVISFFSLSMYPVFKIWSYAWWT
ncbi:MAG TPA: hypothetical protein VHS96_04585 [Bacteroidia bacterium]|nr:hypothetical protein [Bacteroidia bacterium]